MANNLKGYDANQVLRSVFDVDKNTLRVSIVDGSTGGGDFEVVISHLNDSIRLGDGTNFFTSTTVGPKVGLDVNVISSGSVPAGAATEAKQDVGNASLASIDSKLTSPLVVSSTNLDIRDLVFATDKVDASGSTVALDAPTLAALESITVQNGSGAAAVNIQDGGNSITVDGTVAATQSGTWNINNVTGTVSLPTGAATEATLVTRLADATFIARINTLGQKTMVNSTPVVLASDQSAIPVTDNGGSLTVDGSVTVTQATGTNLHTVVDSGAITVNNASGASAVNIQDGGNSITVDGSVSLSGTSSVNVAQVGGNTVTTGSGASATGTQRVILATDQPVIPVSDNGGSLTVDNGGTFAVQVSSSALPTGASTLAEQQTQTASLSVIDDWDESDRAKVNPIVGQAGVAAGAGITGVTTQRVVIVTDQTAIPASQSGTWNINNVSGTVSLPTGASTSALQTTGNSSLSSIDGKLPTLATATPSLTASAIPVRPIPYREITYSASAVAFVPPAAATDIFTITGSASTTVYIKSIEFSMTTTAGSGALATLQIVKRSTADTAGTRVAATVVPHDSNFAAGTATVGHYTANPTLGTAVGTIRSVRYYTTAVGSVGSAITWDFSEQPIVLRGTAQQIALNLNGATITGPIACCNIEWSEV